MAWPFLAKLEANGFQPDASNIFYDYLSSRKQRVKINETISSWKDIEYGAPQESILSPLLFNIHLCYLFWLLSRSVFFFSCSEPSTALIDGSSIESYTKEILVGITIDRDLKFDCHVNNLYKKSCWKLNALALALIKTNSNESFHRIAIWILPISLDIP